MTPSVDERLASIVRALTGVVLPSLPAEASLAQEQVQLCIGHLQILRAQLDDSPAFEAGELADAIDLGRALQPCQGSTQTATALAALEAALTQAEAAHDPKATRAARVAVNAAIASVVSAVSVDGDAASRKRLSETILDHEKRRVAKDRRWFAAFGFDSAVED